MSQTYHQANAESESSGCLGFSIIGVLLLSVLAMLFVVAVSLKPGSGSATGGTDGSMNHGATVGKISVSAFDLGFDKTKIDVSAAGDYEVTLVNTGSAPHDITFPDGQTLAAKAGETVTKTMTIPAGGTSFLCSIPGHAAAGMKGTLTVAGAAVGGANDHGGPMPTTDVAEDPNAPAYVLRDPTAPALLPGSTHDIDLVMNEKLMTVAKGYSQLVWTFGDSVPGPVLRVKVGDLVRIHLKNPATNKMAHSIDFHSSLVAWNDEMTSIQPGEEKVYEFKAKFAGVWMYHCGTAPEIGRAHV